ncbi:helix-turn-helix domain-containing protein [Streptomyces sp. NPDC056230]|uniref:helix-turn-helix domain-containing protein n=1 Tax=unclassified Streptomyces TaxID=2593676 RepID=UPI0035E0C2AA
MTPNDQAEMACPGPGCSNTLKQAGVGRRRRYCCDQCGARCRRQARLQPPADNDTYAAWAIEELRTLIGQFDVTSGDPQFSLELIVRCEQAWKDLKTAVILQSRDHKLKMPVIADTLHISADTLSRMLRSAPDRRERRLPPSKAAPPSAAPHTVPSPRHPRPGPERARRPKGGTGDTDGAAPGHGPGATLASALSHLHRTKGTTHKALGDAVGVDPSYISRVVSGERLPSWKVTRKLAVELGEDPEALRPLWNAARGYRTVEPTSFYAALRGLHLAATCPGIGVIQARTHLPADDITSALEGSRLPDWGTVNRVVTALQGEPETIRPLWNAARAAVPPGTEPSSSPAFGCTILAGTFG